MESVLLLLVMKSRLPYDQVGVGVNGGTEVAVHTLRSFTASKADREDPCCDKIDFLNAYNECHRDLLVSVEGSAT